MFISEDDHINSGPRFLDEDSFENILFSDGIQASSAYVAGKSLIMNDDGEMVIEIPAETYADLFLIAIATVLLLAGIGTIIIWKKKIRSRGCPFLQQVFLSNLLTDLSELILNRTYIITHEDRESSLR